MAIIVLNRSISLEDLKIIRILMLKLSSHVRLTAVVWQPVTRMAGLRHCVRSNISRFLLAASRPSPQMLP